VVVGVWICEGMAVRTCVCETFCVCDAMCVLEPLCSVYSFALGVCYVLHTVLAVSGGVRSIF